MRLRHLGSPASSPSTRRRLTIAALVTALLATLAVGFTVSSPAAAASPAPVGFIDAVTVVPAGIQVYGWTLQPGSAASLPVNITTNGALQRTLLADSPRTDVGAAYPGLGNAHGFVAQLPLGPGTYSVCVSAAGGTGPIGCRSATVGLAPTGSIESVTQVPGGVHVSGWTIDPASPAPTAITVTANGAAATFATANVARSDIAALYPGWGAAHGFDFNFPIGAGSYSICVTSRGAWSAQSLGCRSVTVSNTPIGDFDTAFAVPNGVQIGGWAIDPNNPGPAFITLTANGAFKQVTLATSSRTDIGAAFPGYGNSHGFDFFQALSPGAYSLCIVATNVAANASRSLGCRTVVVPQPAVGSLDTVFQAPGGIELGGWALSQTTTAPISVKVTVNGTLAQTVTANTNRSDVGAAYPGFGSAHGFDTFITLTTGTYSVCAIAVAPSGATANIGCRTLAINFNPVGSIDSAVRTAPGTLTVLGWAFDPDTSAPINVSYSIDGGAGTQVTANLTRSDVAAVYPSQGALHGYSITAAISSGQHLLCVTAINVSFGADSFFGCRDIIAIGATAPSNPVSPTAQAGFGTATVSWTPPNDGGAQVQSYTVTSSPGNIRGQTVSSSIILSGFQPGTTYTFTVSATNVIGTSGLSTTAPITTFTAPTAQTTQPPVSSSRYVRNLTGGASDATYWRTAGATDAAGNPSGHWYVSLLDIGGQSSRNGVNGVQLSATSTWVSNAQLVTAMNAYVDGYRSAQAPSAPVVIAIGTNNDSTVSNAMGQIWASQVINAVAAHLGSSATIEIAGANDIEPGFSATPDATVAWLDGYLSATGQPFVFNGSADGCNSTAVNGSCNNGWTAAYLYQLSAGRSPSRMFALPQIYNTTMAAQWHYISATGVVNGLPKVNFGGVLTEVTACAQAGGRCGSLPATTAWPSLYNAIQGDSRTALGTLPWATDLKIN